MKGRTILFGIAGGVVAFALLTCGVVSTLDTLGQQESRAVASHQKDVDTAIKDKKVLIGMTTDEVKRAWGKPRSVDRTITGNHEHENWFYGSGTLLVFMDGKVRSISKSSN